MLFGTPNLLLFAIAGLLLALLALTVILRSFSDRLSVTEAVADTPVAKAESDVMGLLKHNYIVLLILSNVFMVMVYNFIDFMFYDFTKARYQDEAELAMFIGPFFAVVQTINILSKTF